MKLLILSLVLAGLMFGLVPRSVVLNWTDDANPVGTTYTVYRASGACASSPVFSVLSAGVTGKTYTDSAVTSGKYCYQVTAVYSTLESDPSNEAEAQLKPFKPTLLTVTVP